MAFFVSRGMKRHLSTSDTAGNEAVYEHVARNTTNNAWVSYRNCTGNMFPQRKPRCILCRMEGHEAPGADRQRRGPLAGLLTATDPARSPSWPTPTVQAPRASRPLAESPPDTRAPRAPRLGGHRTGFTCGPPPPPKPNYICAWSSIATGTS